MNLLSATLLATAAIADAKLGNSSGSSSSSHDRAEMTTPTMVMNMSPNDVGCRHNEMFETLRQQYATEKPQSKMDLMMDVSNILSTYCEGQHDGDDESSTICDAPKLTLAAFHRAARKTSNNNNNNNNNNVTSHYDYPADLDPRAIQSMDDAIEAINLLKTDGGVDAVLESLSSIQDKLETETDMEEGHKAFAQAVVSVASESTKLWYSVYTDPDHALYGLHHESYYDSNNHDRRHLVLIPLPDTINVIQADVQGAMQGIAEATIKNPNFLFSTPALLTAALAASFPASAAESMQT